MNTELRLHGHIDDRVEYFATAAGFRTTQHHFFQVTDRELRLFAPGNEMVLKQQGIRQSGNGGSFCEYMFGVDQPLADLTKEGILNRLILLGASYDADGQLQISDSKDLELSFERIFFEGHAVYNYFLFIDGLEGSNQRQQQEQILRLLGKQLKRLPSLNQQDDSQLCHELITDLPKQCTLYLVRLIHTQHRHYLQEFQRLYYTHRSIPDSAYNALQKLAEELDIDRYQQERIRIDVMYRHRDNYRIIDEYKKVLTECYQQGQVDRQRHARLTRLKTLSVRNKIPAALFQTLEDQLKAEPGRDIQEPESIAITRQILQGIFIAGDDPETGIDTQDMLQLLQAKQQAHRNRDHTFELLLLETGKLCDEQIRDGAPISLLENFSYIITFFDRYDSTSTQISQLAFMENYRITEDLLRSLLGSQLAFNKLQEGLFSELFFTEILDNNYLGRYGRRKLVCLRDGLLQITADRSTLQELNYQLKELDAEERLYSMVLNSAKERIRNSYSRYNSRSEQEQLLSELNEELLVRGIISDLLDPSLFRAVIHDIKKEAMYLHSLLPEIISRKDRDLREDFLSNSGLDRFYVEELERDYFNRNHIELEHLQHLTASNEN